MRVTRNPSAVRCHDGDMPAVHAIVLAGGRARRLGGADKLLLRVDGRPLLARVVAAVRDADQVVVVGPRREIPLPRDVTWVREDPPFGGPADAVAAGFSALQPGPGDEVLVLAGDLVRPDLVVDALRPGLGTRVGVDPAGRVQWACARVDAAELAASVTRGETAGRSLRALLGPLHPAEVALTAEACADLDTPDDVKEYADDER